ncbi:hypothetical protein [Caulobacter sp. UC70_42]|uniref:hypothetical protein n=1 Tax=Caulobacter sp. UC70_42 TaxID=3374551 RepID=UPI003756344E
MKRLAQVLLTSVAAVMIATTPMAAPLDDAPAAKAGKVADPIPKRTEGIGPFNRVVLRNVTMIDGTGAPAQGPVDIVLVNDRIAEIRTIGRPRRSTLRPAPPRAITSWI